MKKAEATTTSKDFCGNCAGMSANDWLAQYLTDFYKLFPGRALPEIRYFSGTGKYSSIDGRFANEDPILSLCNALRNEVIQSHNEDYRRATEEAAISGQINAGTHENSSSSPNLSH